MFSNTVIKEIKRSGSYICALWDYIDTCHENVSIQGFQEFI